jgi:hypothetical protein
MKDKIKQWEKDSLKEMYERGKKNERKRIVRLINKRYKLIGGVRFSREISILVQRGRLLELEELLKKLEEKRD